MRRLKVVQVRDLRRSRKHAIARCMSQYLTSQILNCAVGKQYAEGSPEAAWDDLSGNNAEVSSFWFNSLPSSLGRSDLCHPSERRRT